MNDIYNINILTCGTSSVKR